MYSKTGTNLLSVYMTSSVLLSLDAILNRWQKCSGKLVIQLKPFWDMIA